jgi:hypothetical protein
VLSDLGALYLDAGDYDEADRTLRSAIDAFRELGHQRGVARQLESLAWCASLQQRDKTAVTLASAAAAIRHRIAAPAKQAERQIVERTLAQSRARIAEDVYAAAWQEGLTATLEDLLAAGPATDQA